MKNNPIKLALIMDNMHQRTLEGSQLWIRNNNDCLTIMRGSMGNPIVENVEGEWTEEEIKMAIHLYQFTDAAKR